MSNIVSVTQILTDVSGSGPLGVDDTVQFTLVTDVPVNVTGTPELTLSNGAIASYIGADAQGQPIFSYTVQAGDDTSDLSVTGVDLDHGSLASGSFGIAAPVVTSGSFGATAVADVNGDGLLDVLACPGGPTIGLHLGNADGTFTTAADAGNLFQIGFFAEYLTVGDVNGDGKADLIAFNGGMAQVQFGNGDGSFSGVINTFQAPDAAGVNRAGAALVDVNKDGKADLLVASAADDGVTVLLGNGDGTFNSAGDVQTRTPGSEMGAPYQFIVADLNGDGNPDIIAPKDASHVSVNLGNGDGTFTAAPDATPVSFFPFNQDPVGPYSFATGDVNGDGKLDLITGEWNESSVSVLLGNGDGTFGAGTAIQLAGQLGASHVTALDVNGDGNADILAWGLSTPELFLSNGDGTFTPTDIGLFASKVPLAVGVGDTNGDGQPDLVMVDSQSINTFLNNSVPSAALDPASLATAAGHDTGLAVDTAPHIQAVRESVTSGVRFIGDTITFTLTTDIPVTVDTTNGAPTLTLNDHGTAVYDAAESTATSLVFTYTVAQTDISVGTLKADTFNLNGATVQNSAGIPQAFSFDGLTQAGPAIDHGPEVADMIVTPSSGSYGVHHTVSILVEMTTPVAVTGTAATLTLDNGGVATLDAANTAALSRLGFLAFDYTVAAGQDTAALGVASINLNGTVIVDSNGVHGDFAQIAHSFADVRIDTAAPVLTLPAGLTYEATGADGAVATFTAQASDAIDGTETVIIKEGDTVVHSGDVFSLGQHVITASATDAAGNTAASSFVITVRDTTAPSLAPVANQTITATSVAGAHVSFSASSSDLVDGAADAVTFKEGTTAVQSGDLFAIGRHTITASAADAAGNIASETFTVTVNQLPTFNWARAVDGSFEDATNWNRTSVPGIDAAIALNKTGTYEVTASSNHTLGSITIGAKDATLDLLGSAFIIDGNRIDNSGTITLDSANGTDSAILIEGNTTLQGSGRIVLDSDGSSSITGDPDGNVGDKVLKVVDQEISGSGSIGDHTIRLDNQGTIVAHSGALIIDTGVHAITNHFQGELISSGAGAALGIFSPLANSAVVTAEQGGFVATMTLSNSGVVPVTGAGSHFVAGAATNTGLMLADSGGVMDIFGTLKNVAAIDPGVLGLEATHGGTITLHGAVYNSASIVSDAGGRITALGAVINSGVVDSDGQGSTVDLSGTVRNTGTMSAHDGGHLDVTGSINGGGTLLADDAFMFVQRLTGGGSAVISGTGTIEFGAKSDAHVAFSGGTGGSLVLDHAAVFTGDVSGFAAGDSLDFANIRGVASGSRATQVSYADNGTGTGGTLTVTDFLGHAASLTMIGHYDESDFVLGSDTSGHLLVQHSTLVV